MKKVKLKMNLATVAAIANGLQKLIAATPANNSANKIHIALWVECYLTLLQKTLFAFAGEKKITLSPARALALSDAFFLMDKSHYLDIVYLEFIREIDQQTT